MNKNAGFTLLEVLVAIALASILLTSIYGVVATTSAVKEQVEQQGAALHLGRVLIARLDRELLGLTPSHQGATPALIGGENSLGQPYLELLTNSSSERQPGVRQISYRLGPDPDGIMTLWRAEKGLNMSGAANEENLAHGIDKLSFRFFNGQNWLDQWNSLGAGQPMLVQVEFVLQGIKDMPPLVGTFDLPRNRRSP